MTHPTPATSSTTRKLSPAMQAVVDAMRDGISLQYTMKDGKWRMADLLASSIVSKQTMNALLGRGLITRIDSGPTAYDLYVLTPAGLAAATPPAAVTSDLAFDADDDVLVSDETTATEVVAIASAVPAIDPDEVVKVVSSAARTAMVTVMYNGQSYTRHLQRQGDYWMGYAIPKKRNQIVLNLRQYDLPKGY